MTGLQLPFHFDPDELKADLARVRTDEWQPHFNEADYGGKWTGVALRSTTGSTAQLAASPVATAAVFKDTELLDRCPSFREVVSALQCPLKSVRLLSLAAGSFVREHRDAGLGYESGEMRIHVPVQTSLDVEFYVNGERLDLAAGNCYYVNVNLPHRIQNRGSQDRVHLVIDVEVNEWAADLVVRSRPITRLPHRDRGWESFRQLAVRDTALAERLHAGEPAVEIARELSFDFTGDEIGNAPIVWDEKLPQGWTPVTAEARGDELSVEWRYMGSGGFRVVAPLAAAPEGREPSGFVFHMSRGGSVSPAIDIALQTGCADWVRAMVMALGASVVTFEPWHIHALPLIRTAFPQTRWIFVSCDPQEVLESQLDQPEVWAMAGVMNPSLLGMTFADAVSLSREQWITRALDGFVRSANQYRDDPLGMFLDDRQWADAGSTVLA